MFAAGGCSLRITLFSDASHCQWGVNKDFHFQVHWLLLLCALWDELESAYLYKFPYKPAMKPIL